MKTTDGRRFLTAAAGLMLLTLLAYLPSFSARFLTLDDYQYVVDNELVRKPAYRNVETFFKEVIRPSTVAGYYQPLTMISLMVDAWIAGDKSADPFVYHATNILLHAINVVIVMWIMRMLVGGITVPLIVAAFFALHPVQVESVAWISQRKTVLASLFAFASVAMYLHYGKCRRYRFLLAALLCYLLGGLAKPTIMFLPLGLILLDYWPLRRPVLRALGEKLPFAALMGVMATIAWRSQMSTAALGVPKLSMDRIVSWIGLLSYNLTLYLGNLVWPMHLSPYRAIPRDLSLANPAIFVSTLAAVAFGLSVITAPKWSKSYFTGAVGFILLLSPALGGVQFYGSCVSDRFLYLPMLFILMPLAVSMRTLLSRRTIVPRVNSETGMPKTTGMCTDVRAGGVTGETLMAKVHSGNLSGKGCVYGMALLVIPMLILTRAQQTVWQNSRNLWFYVQTAVPDLAKANRHVATIYHDEGDFEKARLSAERAVKAEPEDAQGLHLLARILTRTGSPQRAVELIHKALDVGLGNKEGWGYISLAEAELVLGDLDQARQALGRAEALGRDDATSLAMLGDVALDYAHKCQWAVDFYEKALDKAPDDLDIRFRLGAALRACDRNKEALLEYETIIERARKRGLRYPKVEAAADPLRKSMNDPSKERGK